MMKPFFVWQDKVLKRIDPENVICLETIGNYTKFVFSDKQFYHVRTSLSRAIKKLPPDIFIKISRSMVASIYFINDIDRNHLIISGEIVLIGKEFYPEVISKLDILK